jgi:FkbM family methyltransferase
MVAVLTMIKVISALKHRLKILIECLILIINKKYGKYKFQLNDIYLYYLEKTQPIFPIKKKKFKNLLKISIQNKTIFWPKSIDYVALPWLYNEVFIPFDKNPSSYNHPNMLIQKKNWIIDAGAAEGYFSIFAAEKTKYRATILAIEPLSIMRNSLLQTAKLNNIKYFKHLPFALSNKKRGGLFDQNPKHICDSKINVKNIKSSYTELVTISTIDKILEKQNFFGKGMIKMDIEGFEMKALEGAKNTLKTLKPSLAIAVYHEYDNANRCAEIIQKANSEYKIELRGCYGYFKPARPYMLFAY